MYDWETDSRWASVTGKAIVGPLAGTVLTTYPATQTSWAAWLNKHPQTLVLKKPKLSESHYKGYDENRERLGIHGRIMNRSAVPAKDKVVGFDIEGNKFAIPLNLLQPNLIYQFHIDGGVPLLILTDDSGQGINMWRRNQGDRVLTIFDKLAPDQYRVHSGNADKALTFDARTGMLSDGLQLERVQTTIAYWFGWNNFYPDTKVVRDVQ